MVSVVPAAAVSAASPQNARRNAAAAGSRTQQYLTPVGSRTQAVMAPSAAADAAAEPSVLAHAGPLAAGRNHLLCVMAAAISAAIALCAALSPAYDHAARDRVDACA